MLVYYSCIHIFIQNINTFTLYVVDPRIIIRDVHDFTSEPDPWRKTKWVPGKTKSGKNGVRNYSFLCCSVTQLFFFMRLTKIVL